MFSIMLTSEVCWCVFSITIVYLSLYFLASNPLIILTDPSPAKIQNQHTTGLGWGLHSDNIQAGRVNTLAFLLAGWSQSLAVMHSVAVAAPVSVLGRGEPGLNLYSQQSGAGQWIVQQH